MEVKNSLVRKMETGNPKSVEFTKDQKERSGDIEQPIAIEFKEEPTQQRAANEGQKEVLDRADKTKEMAHHTEGDDEHRRAKTEPAKTLVEQTATKDDVKGGCASEKNKKAAAEKTNHDEEGQRANIEEKQTEERDALKTRRTKEIQAMTLQDIMEWKKNGWLNDDEFCRLKAAWFKSACV